MNLTLTKVTLGVIAAFQFAVGLGAFIPGVVPRIFDLEPGPEWVNWVLALFGARAVGYGFGMVLAAIQPVPNWSWIGAMVLIQAIDFIATLAYVAAGVLTVSQVRTVLVFPPLFVAVLGWHLLKTKR